MDDVVARVYAKDFLDEYLRVARSEAEVRELVDFLIANRELIRDAAIARLEEESRGFVKKLRENARLKLLEELACFRDVLRLHKRRLEHEER